MTIQHKAPQTDPRPDRSHRGTRARTLEIYGCDLKTRRYLLALEIYGSEYPLAGMKRFSQCKEIRGDFV